MKCILYLMISCLFAATSLIAQQPKSSSVPARLEKAIPGLMKRDNIPGLTIAYIQQGNVVWTQQYGVVNADTRKPVTDTTLFEAASLTKVVTAYTALKLVEAGKLRLDTPLNAYLGNNYHIGNDARIHLITGRRVLTHTTGFPNWRNDGDSILPIQFTPGERFSYSGEGFVYLSKVMEKITGIPYEQQVTQMVFTPLGMKHSDMTYHKALRNNYAYRHNWLKQVSRLPDYTQVNPAASMRTTAKDYALFLAAILNHKGMTAATQKEMLTPQIQVDTARPQLAWGLGIGLENTSTARYAWHWGDQGDSKALFMVDVKSRNGFVYFTNSANGLSIGPDIMDIVFGKQQHDIAKFIGYGKFEEAAANLMAAIKKEGTVKALQDYEKNRKQVISEGPVNTIGYILLKEKKNTEAIAVFTQNTKDHPASSNAWDSLAEAYMNQGDTIHAIEYYEKSLALDPGNKNAEDQLKKLKK